MKQTPKLFWAILLLTTLGLIFSVRLLMLDYSVLSGGGANAECNINAAFNCSAVARSAYAFLLGIPVAAWGLLGYALVLLWLALNRDKDLRRPLLLAYGLFSLVSLYYFGITKLKLDVICLYCLFTYLINWLTTAVLAVANFQKPSPSLQGNWGLQPALWVGGVILGLGILIPSYQFFPHSSAQTPSTAETPGSSKPKHGGPTYPLGRFDKALLQASAGSEKEAVTLEVFSDYQCPFCAQFETTLQTAMQEFSNLHLIRKEFPLDKNCNRLLGNNQMHANACQAAYFAKCAGLQDKFWEAAESLHARHAEMTNTLMANTLWASLISELKLDGPQIEACMQKPEIHNSVLNDVQEGLYKGVNSTPSYWINGQKQAGIMPYPQFKELLLKAGGKLKN
ncbi:hypothetical protein COW36_21660 [bacterium (Candidatus Blackallbacteria) CG17_big_fil_post_rev_8_21_14_2_50_48_46]|uniref:Vitamin K epoxide reductase domain-containing protein n=1 Tax=bacterium (Candidatus Blackallbacteria) CG17_big_fil_post_rev_8_21_14_2_50_48_46 TaxID=2014261 RepID=A0A2M7FZ78_9BACT|nr:MAG: hypothetical protein COW64_14960 [bacterium (Candidatus Blackallbacteria) CG18_big_fil_WC_8_21_14_2_50_49_26]PIW14647.1 MAG: hypothetical protein COW36_21660 [bacterium (Candidatus Blackallbacteria) CG17_big_fil_post_rev_8_21_14_2_50_48_46]PIW45698.1 MAG: hypothetical protein COW20_19490 [bacterium (Candidatus Blackallbacteria) CG13_big_fil_rev_8_21_14_2_50_49_14]